MVRGSAEVIKLLENYLVLAKTGKWGGAAIVLTQHPGEAAADFTGDPKLLAWTLNMTGLLHNQMLETVENGKRPEQDSALDFDHVCYNMTTCPLGFDFLIWLIDAEMTRAAEGAPGPLKVGFWCGRDPAKLSKLAANWLNNVYRPLLPLLGAVEDDTALRGHCKEMYMPRDIVAACREGAVVPRLRSRQPVEQHGKVTITLRETSYATDRNSDVASWLRFAERLNRDVIVVRDTARADEPLPGFKTDPRASRDLQHRFALYEGAAVNMFVGNGPSGLALFGSKPCLIFIRTKPDSNEYWNRPEVFGHAHGINVGEQYPWMRPYQRIVWQPDTYDNIVAAWDRSLDGESRSRQRLV